MMRVLNRFARSPIACTFCISCGVGVMLSVATLNPEETAAIHLRQAVGSILLLLPGFVQRWRDEEESD